MATPNDIARRFFETLLAQPFDDSFDASDVWMYMPRLLDCAARNVPLPPTCVALLGELAEASGLRAGATLPDVLVAIERTFGECPFGTDELLMLGRYLREQRNGGFSTVTRKKGPSIRGEF